MQFLSYLQTVEAFRCFGILAQESYQCYDQNVYKVIIHVANDYETLRISSTSMAKFMPPPTKDGC